MRRRLAAVATAFLLAGGAVAGAPGPATARADPSPPAYRPPPVVFGPCTNAALSKAGAQCGTVIVPLDYAAPRGRTISLAISRIRHTTPDAQAQGVMLVNPGGPGDSGLDEATLGAAVPRGVGGAYDWIGFDPRGVGASRPALSCEPGYAGYRRPPYAPDDPRDEAAWRVRTTRYAGECAAHDPVLLAHLRTVDSARDIESIRQALGQPQISYYGFSYGTYLGSVYATLYPDRVRRMVFDGVVDPTRVWERANTDQDVAFETSIGVFFDWVARHDAVYHLGTTGAAVRHAYDEQTQRLRSAPAGGRIGPSEWNDIVLQAGYYVFGWEGIASAFSAWATRGDPAGLLALYPPPADDNDYAVYLGVQCTDAAWSGYPAFRAENAALAPRAPFETWANAWFNAPCTAWPARAGTPTRVDGSHVPPVLLVSETRDAATPFAGALAVRRLFPRSALVEGTGGTTHAGTLAGTPGFGSPCENDAVADYLATGALPPRLPGTRSDRQCAPNPQPTPTALTPPTDGSTGSPASRAAGLGRWEARR